MHTGGLYLHVVLPYFDFKRCLPFSLSIHLVNYFSTVIALNSLRIVIALFDPESLTINGTAFNIVWCKTHISSVFHFVINSNKIALQLFMHKIAITNNFMELFFWIVI